ncbi:MAG: FecR domain-containing protein [Rhizobiales bacterium]|nr:FecR domain-containing protein [Hyphomicrobiales bacterium]MBN9010067.1 FecR domain-containing protein [Hyphomicrobiales bacterium]
MGIVRAGAAALAFAAAIGSALAAPQQAGSAVAVIQATNVEGGGGTRVLAVKGDVFMGDKVETGKSGQAQLLFLDDTRMVVGPNSKLTIDAFVYKGSTASRFGITAVKGAFRFITGTSEKQAYVITTPTATIGVRGTRFDFTVDDDGATSFALYEGGVAMCDRAPAGKRRCANITGACSVVVLPPRKDFQWVKDVNKRTALFKSIFPYAFRQASLRPDFRVSSGRCNVTYGTEEPQPTRPNAPSQPNRPGLGNIGNLTHG